MSSFQALNIDYDQVAAEQEIDDTKELQIEDALKLYQAALKYHAEGTQSYEKALGAYKELFDSDIFKYPEAQSELARADTFPEYEEMWIENFQAGPVQLTTSAETAPNTLSQLVYLSYKNHGRFLLDLLQWRVQEHVTDQPNTPLPYKQIATSARQPLDAYSEALDKDDTDVELWRSSAAVAQLVGCNRIARFCLEAVLDMGEESLDDILGLPNVEQTLSLSKLQEMVKNLQDDVSKSMSPLSNARKQKLGEALVRRLESHALVPKPTFEETAYSELGQLGRTPLRYMMNVGKRDWTSVGEIILQQQTLIESGMVDTGPGVGIGITFPEQAGGEVVQAAPLSLPERPRSAGSDYQAAAAQLQQEASAAQEGTERISSGQNGTDNVQVANGDQDGKASKDNADKDTGDRPPTDEAADQQDTASAPGRKRSPDSAELPEDDGRGRSKRMRNRETMDGGKVDPAKINADWQLNIYKESDEFLVNAANTFLQKLHIPDLISPTELRALVGDEERTAPANNQGLNAAIKDFYVLSTSCTPEIASILNNGVNNENIDSFGAVSREAGLNAFLGSSSSRGSQACIKPVLGATEGLGPWVEDLNSRWYYPHEAAWNFLTALLQPGCFPGSRPDDPSSYLTHRWPEDLKRCVVQLAVRFDDDVYSLVESKISMMSSRELKSNNAGIPFALSQDDLNIIELVQTLFELHLDVYSLIKRPGTNVDNMTRTSQKDRLERWSALANVAINLCIGEQDEPSTDALSLRHIWATAFHISVCDNVSQSHILSCMKDLKALFLSAGEPYISLQNNAVIPEISMAAIEQELSKINMKDFFTKIFSDGDEDPVETIESLEPLLEGSLQGSTCSSSSEQQVCEETDDKDKGNEDDAPGGSDLARVEENVRDPTPQEQMSKFLANSTWTLRLSLWQRLRQAYKAIDYPPKVASCHLRSIELLTNEMTAVSSVASSETKKLELLRWFHLIDEFVRKLLNMHNSNPEMFECVDFDHLKSSITAVTWLVQMLHSFNLYEDQVRVGSLPSPTFEGKPKPSFTITSKWMHNLQLRLWMLLYRLFQEAIEQDPEAFEEPAEARFEYLRTLHYALGHRKMCNEANRELLHLLLDETLKLSDLEYSDTELSQIVFDLYNLKFAPNPQDELMDHGCSDHEVLTRKSALKLLGFFMSQAQQVNMKDMPKSEIKSAVDKVQGALGKGKGTDDLLLNSRVYSSFMKSTVNPLDLFSCLRGTFDIPTKPIPDADAPVASKGWYFLLGLIALNKFRSVKRLQPGPCEDLMVAQAFFRQDIEFSSDHWESWYRLAQVNDLQLEEHVSWSAEKLNAHAHEIFHYQRHALHAYAMAISGAVRCADESPKTVAILAEMYADFGNRIYASSRDPFSMLAFGFQDKEERHFSGDVLYQRPPFNPLQVFTAWRLASVLFRRSMARAPEVWPTYYMLGKSLWKMYTYEFPEGSSDVKYRPSRQEVLDCFVNAIKKLPKRDSRKEPILEPHYKLVSIVHKLVRRGDLSRADAQETLKISSYAAKVPTLGSTEGQDESWTEYMMSILKSLRSADKAGWHHRMTARAAHLVYDESPQNPVSAMEAKLELTQQMFTKTMVLQVWKPEFEKPGRHFVYTTRYVRFFVQLLSQLGDRESLSALVKRLRRKPDQYFDHNRMWHDTCIIYLKLLRKAGSVPEGYEDAIFKSLNHEDFTGRSAKLEAWCHTMGDKSVTYGVLTDVIELKKVNNGLMKATLIDDLLGDTYAKLYEEIGPEQLSSVAVPKAEGAGTPAPTPPAPLKPMALTSVMNADSGSEAPRSFATPQPPEQPTSSKARKTGVGRREIQRKAEAAVNRPVTAGMPARSNSISSSTQPSTSNLVQVVVPSPRTSMSGSKPPTIAAAPSTTPVPTNTNTPAATTATAAAAINSDDESELSELEEEPEEPSQLARPTSLFANLAKNSPAASSTTARDHGDGDDEGDDEEEEEEEEEEEGNEGDDEDGESGPNRDEDGDEKMES